jgi:hypothetical protein
MTFPNICVSLYLLMIIVFWISAVCLYFRFHMGFFAAESGADFGSLPAEASPRPTKFQGRAAAARRETRTSKGGFTDCRVVFTAFNWETPSTTWVCWEQNRSDGIVPNAPRGGEASKERRESAKSDRLVEVL